LLEVLGKPLDSTFVTIHEVEMENWGRGGLPTLEFRKRRAAARETRRQSPDLASAGANSVGPRTK
jgi:4-oxalocrotonate tautomerase